MANGHLIGIEGGAQGPDLASFDWILVNTSAGKDSQAMLDLVVERAREAGVLDRVVAVHADLGRVEWAGTRELAEEQVAHYGLRFEVVSRPQGDLLTHIRKRGLWPGNGTRYCTSEHKRGQVATLMTRLAGETRERKGKKARARILNVMGLRAQESPARAKKTGHEYEVDTRASNGRREVWTWLPILDWTVERVWARIRQAGTRHHPAYDLGMPRLSCVFCVFASREALMVAGERNRELLADYVEAEAEMGHSFRKDFRIAEIQEALERGERGNPAAIKTWAA